MDLKIIVPVHIPEFVPIQKAWFEYIKSAKYCKHLDIDVFMEPGDAPSGRNVRQKYTDIGCLDYIHFLDNDNLISIYVLQKIYSIYSPIAPKIFMFDQIWWANGPKRLIAKPENCVPCKCDIAQLFVHGKFLKDMVWTDRYENDGDFIQQLYKRYPDDFVFINDVNVWYNALKPGHGLYEGEIKLIA